MDGFLPIGNIGDLGAAGLLSLVVLLMLFGWLIPRRWHERAMEDQKQETEYWRNAFESSQQIKMELVSQNTKLLANTDLTVAILESVRRRSERSQE